MSESEVDDLEVSVNEPNDPMTKVAEELLHVIAEKVEADGVGGVDFVVIALKGLGQGGRVFQGIGTTIVDPMDLGSILAHAMMAVIDPRVGKILAEKLGELRDES